MTTFGTVLPARVAANGWRVEVPVVTEMAAACIGALGGEAMGVANVFTHWAVPRSSTRQLLDLARRFGWETPAELHAAAWAMTQTKIESHAVDTVGIEIPAPIGCEYMPHQKAGIQFALRRKAVLLADSPGAGKSQQAIGLINALPDLERILIVCPASLKNNWMNEAKRWLVRPLSIGIVTGSQWIEADVTLINYDILHAHIERLTAVQWDLLIADEAHVLRSPGARRVKAFAQIQAKRRLYLTGTPILNHPGELYPILRSLDPDVCPTRAVYDRLYAGHWPGDTKPRNWDFSGPVDPLTELQTWLRETVMIRRTKEEVLTLPPKRHTVIELPAVGAVSEVVAREVRAYTEHEAQLRALKGAVSEATGGDVLAYRAAVKALRVGRLTAFTSMSTLRRETAVAKLPQAIAYLKDALATDKKIVAFAYHVEVLNALAHAFGPAAVSLTGSTAAGARQAAVERFQTDPSCTLFLGSLGAAGVGITLTAAARLIFVELDWVPSVVAQAADRIYRIGQEFDVLIEYLVLEGSLDATIAKRIVAKQEVIDRAINRPGEIAA